MHTLLIVIHIVACLSLIMIVLLQTGKGSDMGSAFGGGASQALLGASGASTFMSKATTGIAILFMLTSLTLAYMSGNKSSSSVMSDTPIPVEQPLETESTDK